MSGLEVSLLGRHDHEPDAAACGTRIALLVDFKSQDVLPACIKCCSTVLSEERCSLRSGVDKLPLPAGINAAQWNYQRDAAANHAWEDRKELLMDWSSSVVKHYSWPLLCLDSCLWRTRYGPDSVELRSMAHAAHSSQKEL